jgi:hexosaminidase
MTMLPLPAKISQHRRPAPDLGKGLVFAGPNNPLLTTLFEQFQHDVVLDGGSEGGDVGSRTPLRLELREDAAQDVPKASGLGPRGHDPGSERYELRFERDQVTISSPSEEGLFRGLTTLRQLFLDPPSSALVIADGPRSAWRGLSLDVARAFFDVAQVKRVIDLLSLYKFNVLHLHLTDDQGWRVEVPALPRLAEIGGHVLNGGREGGYFTLSDMADLVEYGTRRYVTIVPEADMPGHGGAAVAAYPELAAPGPHGANLLDPSNPMVETFIQEVIGTLAAVAPGNFLHVGGDEAFGMELDAYDRFVDRACEVARASGKTPVCWQDAVRSLDGREVVVQHWIAFDQELGAAVHGGGSAPPIVMPDGREVPQEVVASIIEHFQRADKELVHAMERGAKVILSPASKVYLDRPYQEPSIQPEQEALRERLGLTFYPRATVEQSYAWDPAGTLDPEWSNNVVGVEAAVWAETLATGSELEFMLLPRLPGIAERSWSMAAEMAWPEYRQRLAAQSHVWTARGWSYFASSGVPWPKRKVP